MRKITFLVGNISDERENSIAATGHQGNSQALNEGVDKPDKLNVVQIMPLSYRFMLAGNNRDLIATEMLCQVIPANSKIGVRGLPVLHRIS